MFKSLLLANPLLFYFGLFCLLGACITGVLTFTSHIQVLGINAFIKPTKFFLSTTILVWTLAYYMQFLNAAPQVLVFSWVCVLGLAYELLVITVQAARGRLSHFNRTTPLDSALFFSMGLVIVIVTLHMAYIGYLFFAQQSYQAPMVLIWSIRLAIIVTAIFALQGGAMGGILQHSVGGKDGGSGLKFLNWSRTHGDLRVAHFFGLHALQAIPLLSSLFARDVLGVCIVALLYVAFITFTLMQAYMGRPLVK